MRPAAVYSMMPRSLRHLLAVLGSAVLAPSAVAAPGDPVVVAREGAAELFAAQRGVELCVDFDTRDVETCAGRTSGVVVLGSEDPVRRRGDLVGVVIAARAVTVEVRRAGRLLVSGPTVDGAAYRGTRAGGVRFALLRLPAGARTDGLRVRGLDAAGAAVEVLAADDNALVTALDVLLSGTSRGVRWELRATRSSALVPSLLDLEREEVSRCVRTTVVARFTQRASKCASDAPRSAFDDLFDFGPVEVEDRCENGFRLIHGTVPGALQGAQVLLGDGRRVAARVAPNPAHGTSVYALVLPAAAAVRSVRLEVAGEPVRTVASPEAPLTVACAGAESFRIGGSTIFDEGLESAVAELPVVTPVGPVTTVPGRAPFRVADAPAGTLCLALGDRPFNALGCSVVPPSLGDELLGVTDDIIGAQAFVLALPASVATVRITGKGGRPRAIPTVAGGGYAGAYAGRVRFAAATISGTEELEEMEYLDAAGRVLFRSGGDEDAGEDVDADDDDSVFPPTSHGARRLAGAPGRPSLWQTAYRFGGNLERCLALTAGPRPVGFGAACAAERGAPFTALIGVPCGTHRITLALT